MNPPFRRRGTRLEPQPPPWSSTGGAGAMFLLRGDRGSLQILCNDMLHTTKGLRWEPIDEYVMLTIQYIDGFHSTAVQPAERVSYDYFEAAFWVPVRDTQSGAEAFILPYVFHDRTVPTSVGRELWGLAKEGADVSLMLPNDSFMAKGSVQALVLRPGSSSPAIAPVLELAPPAWQPWFAKEKGGLDLTLGEVLAAFLVELGVSGAALRMLLQAKFDFLLLRQMPAPDGVGCDVQQVVKTPIELDSNLFKARPLFPGHSITLPETVSHPIAEDFGFTLDAARRIVATVGVRASFAFTVGKGSLMP